MPTVPSCRRLTVTLLSTIATLLLTASAARASATTSTNWSGYAVHSTGVGFRSASAEWRQPSASCSSSNTYSSFWVGIGGYRRTSDALEQVGTELDCSAKGSASSSAWYELVPSASHAIRMTISSGDLIRASVTVVDHRVTVTLADLTTNRSFSRTIVDDTLDVTSAEWIAEAPSECSSGRADADCTVLPLADFGTARFLAASATTTAGVTRSLSDVPWTRTKITMAASFVAEAAPGSRAVRTTATATPSSTTGAAGAFDVAYTSSSTSTTSPGSGGQAPTSGPGNGGGPG